MTLRVDCEAAAKSVEWQARIGTPEVLSRLLDDFHGDHFVFRTVAERSTATPDILRRVAVVTSKMQSWSDVARALVSHPNTPQDVQDMVRSLTKG